jgi:hypothetical protein
MVSTNDRAARRDAEAGRFLLWWRGSRSACRSRWSRRWRTSAVIWSRSRSRPADGGVHRRLVRGRTAWATPDALRLYLVLWPFFVWWTVAMLFSFARRSRSRWRCLHASTTRRCVAALIAAARRGAVAAPAAAHPPPRRRDRRPARGVRRLPHRPDLRPALRPVRERPARRALGRCGQPPGTRPGRGDRRSDRERLAFVDVVAGALGGLRARDGAFAAMGNHDYFGDGEAMVSALEAAG